MRNIAITYLIYNNQILFLYKENRKYYVGPGGKNDFGETIYETATREFFEETGLKIEPKLASIAQIYVDESAIKNEYTLFTFYADAYKGNLLKTSSEGILYWKPLEEVNQLPMFPGDKLILNHILSRLQQEKKVSVCFAKFSYDAMYKKLKEFTIQGDENNA